METEVNSKTPEASRLQHDSTCTTLERPVTVTSPSSLNGEEIKEVPNYLRTSTGSCHDLCKYGRKHAFEAKEKYQFRRTSIGNVENRRGSKENIIESGEKSMKSPITLLISSPRKQNKQSERQKALALWLSTHSEKSDKPDKPVKSKIMKPFAAKLSSALNLKRVLEGKNNSLSKITTGPNISEFGKEKVSKLPKNSTDKKPFLSKVPSLISKKNKTAEAISLSKIQNKVKNIKPVNEIKKPLYPLKQMNNPNSDRLKTSNKEALIKRPYLRKQQEPESSKPPMMLRRSSFRKKKATESSKTSFLLKRPPEKKLEGPGSSNKSSLKKPSSIPRLTITKQEGSGSPNKTPSTTKQEGSESPNKTSLVRASQKKQNGMQSFNRRSLELQPSLRKQEGSEFSNKTSLVRNPLQKKHERSQSASKNATNGIPTSKYEGKGRRKQLDIEKVDEKNETTPGIKKFKRGKITNIPLENNGPRRLRFRQVKVLNESLNGKIEGGRRSYRRKTGGTKDGVPEAKTIVLRHQEVAVKRETQGLFNHIIEETVTKLVQTRKSKVKALVGAFETVILLQERKPNAID